MTPLNQPEEIGSKMGDLMADLYPLCRSITGQGLRDTLRRIQREIPIEIVEVPTGTQVFDWTVPREWNIRDAYIKNSRGEKIVDFKNHNLHVMSYSVPVRAQMTLEELKPHLFSLPDNPEWIPYRTSYYKDSWAFCITHNQLESLPEDTYEVCIDSSLEAGSLTYGEYVIPGSRDEEVIITSHCCHPSLCNDNLSGVAVAVQLATWLRGRENRYTYRFVFAPVTIGAITWLATHEDQLDRIKHGLVLTGVGDPGKPTYKRSRRGEALIDRAAQHVLKHTGRDHDIIDYFPYGYDERQYGSAGINLPVGCLMRTPHGRYPEYHTSADNLDFVTPEALVDTLGIAVGTLEILELDGVYVNLSPNCEPQLGKRGLYQGLVGKAVLPGYELALLWVLNQSDGRNSLLEIAERANMPFRVIRQAAQALIDSDLLAPAELHALPAGPRTLTLAVAE